MTMTKDEIRAEIERLEAMLNEPDWAAYEAAKRASYDTPPQYYDNYQVQGLIAAWPHMPETVALQAENEKLLAKLEMALRKLPSDALSELHGEIVGQYLPGVWYDWHEGECPVDGGLKVEVRFVNGETNCECTASAWSWGGVGGPYCITAFRILPD